jgi:hypothetical protein
MRILTSIFAVAILTEACARERPTTPPASETLPYYDAPTTRSTH